jgi:type IV pilus secretin PilQ/predicted competence protein
LLCPGTPSARAQELDSRVQGMMQDMLAAPAGDQPDEPERESTPTSLTDTQLAVSDAGTVTLNVVDLPLTTVLRVLSLETNRNIVSTPSVSGTVTASLHNVTFEEALDAILLSNNAGYRAQGRFIYVYTQQELADIIAAENPPESRVFLLSYISAADLEPAITPLLSPVGALSVSVAPETGIASETEQAGGLSLTNQEYLVVRDRPGNLNAIAAMIRELDVRPRQVLIEATILSAELNEDNALGVDFALVGGVNLELLGATSRAIQDVTLGNLPTDRLEKFNASGITGFTSNVPDGGVRVGIIKDNVAVFIQALEQITDTVVIANPKVLALNKQKGQVLVGRRDGYLTTTVTETQAIQTVEYLETGTNLVFRPFIGNDGYIRMEVRPQDSIGGLTAANLPFEQTAEVTTNVMVQDGQTILIGGLFRETNSDTRSQIPLLGDLPVVGTLFKSRSDSVQRQEVIILLTVHIVKDLDAYAKQSWEQFQDLERVRVGARKGMMWHGRERRAQALYQTALEHYGVGEYDNALWCVRMALHSSPRFVPAIELQEEIRSRREWNDDGTIGRGFIHQAIMRAEGYQEPMFDRPAPPFVRPARPEDVIDDKEDADAS